MAIASTTLLCPVFGADNPFSPADPKADQVDVLMSHLAMLLAATPPAVVRAPPTYRLLPETARAATGWSTPAPRPVPRVDHAVPFHLAMLLAVRPPAVVNWPPT